jgi:hypothetical protein
MPVVHTASKKQFRELMEYLEPLNYLWRGKDKPTTRLEIYDTYKERTAVAVSSDQRYPANLMYCDEKWYRDHGYEIVPFEAFIQKRKRNFNKKIVELVKSLDGK